MSTTRQILTSLKQIIFGTQTIPPVNSVASTKRDSAYKYLRMTVNDNNLKFKIDIEELLVPNTTIEWFDDKQELSQGINLLELNNDTKQLFSTMNEQYKVEMTFRKNNVTITLPENFNTNLVNFIKLFRPATNPGYCCVNFVYEMKFGRSPIPDCNSSQYFYYHQAPANYFSENKLSCGDSVHMADAEFKNHHYAVYLANGYYISLIGEGGPLLISTLDQLKQLYHATQIAKISLFPYPDSNINTTISGRTPNGYFIPDPISQRPSANTPHYFFSKVELPETADKDAKIATDEFGIR